MVGYCIDHTHFVGALRTVFGTQEEYFAGKLLAGLASQVCAAVTGIERANVCVGLLELGVLARGERPTLPTTLLTPANAQRLVLAQDTGGAIVGAVRADLFTGWGSWTDEPYLTAAALKQPLQLWVLWPR